VNFGGMKLEKENQTAGIKSYPITTLPTALALDQTPDSTVNAL
jgi:hypothetical protein